MIRALLLALLLGGCATSIGPIRDEVPVADDVYTRAETDAINAVIQCRLLARNMVEITRCGVRR